MSPDELKVLASALAGAAAAFALSAYVAWREKKDAAAERKRLPPED